MNSTKIKKIAVVDYWDNIIAEVPEDIVEEYCREYNEGAVYDSDMVYPDYDYR